MTRQASDVGIIEIKNAVERIGTKKGWAKQSRKWINNALQTFEEKYPQSDLIVSRNIGISLPTWNRFRDGKRINNIAFEIFCQILELDWEEVAQLEPSEPIRNSFSYISACGLKKPPEKRKIFNDYLSERAIDELWADPLAEIKALAEQKVGIAAYIKAKIKSTEKAENFLRINFVRQGWGVNVTIRPSNETPVNASHYQYMRFKIRAPQKQKVGIRIRIVDADYVFWGYGEPEIFEHKGLSTSSSDWQDVTINLRTKKWFHFKHDGFVPKKHRYRPDLKAIQLITFETGIDNNPLIEEHMTRLGKNVEEAIIDISQIKFE